MLQLDRLMALEIVGLARAAHGERTLDRIDHRDRVSKLRTGSYFPGFLSVRRIGERCPAAIPSPAKPSPGAADLHGT